MEEILKSAAHTHLLFIGTCVAILVFLASVQPNKKYSEALTAIIASQEIFSERLPEIIDEIINKNDELETIRKLIITKAENDGIKFDNSKYRELSEMFIYRVEGMSTVPKFRSDWTLTVREIWKFFTKPHKLVVVFPDKVQLTEKLSEAFAKEKENNTRLMSSRFHLIDDVPLVPGDTVHILLDGEFVDPNEPARAILEVRIDGIVREIVPDLRKHPLVINEIKKSKVNIAEFMASWPLDSEMWGAISEFKMPDLREYLDQKIETGRGKVELLGISLDGRIVQVGGPIALLAISLYLLMLIGELVRCVEMHESIPHHPWFALFPNLLSRIMVSVTLLALPILVGCGVMWIFREESFYDLLVSLCLLAITIILNWHSTTKINVVQTSRNAVNKSLTRNT